MVGKIMEFKSMDCGAQSRAASNVIVPAMILPPSPLGILVWDSFRQSGAGLRARPASARQRLDCGDGVCAVTALAWVPPNIPLRPGQARVPLKSKSGDSADSYVLSVVGHRCGDALISADERSDVGTRLRQTRTSLGWFW